MKNGEQNSCQLPFRPHSGLRGIGFDSYSIIKESPVLVKTIRQKDRKYRLKDTIFLCIYSTIKEIWFVGVEKQLSEPACNSYPLITMLVAQFGLAVEKYANSPWVNSVKLIEKDSPSALEITDHCLPPNGDLSDFNAPALTR